MVEMHQLEGACRLMSEKCSLINLRVGQKRRDQMMVDMGIRAEDQSC